MLMEPGASSSMQRIAGKIFIVVESSMRNNRKVLMINNRLSEPSQEKETRTSFADLVFNYWWLPLAVIVVAAMLTSIIGQITLPYLVNLGLLILSVLAAVGWFTRPKKHKKVDGDSAQSESTSPEIPPDEQDL